jgi:hypothetical protein
MNAAILNRLCLVGNFKQFARGFFGIGERPVIDVFHRTPSATEISRRGPIWRICVPSSRVDRAMPGSRPASASLKTPAKLSRSQRALVEARRGTVEIFARTRPGIKATLPAPLVDVDWATGTARDRADTHIAEIDVPTVLKFGIQAAGKFEHGLLKRSQDASGKLLGICAPSTGATQFISPSPIEFPRLKLAIELNEDCDLACPQFQMR